MANSFLYEDVEVSSIQLVWLVKILATQLCYLPMTEFF